MRVVHFANAHTESINYPQDGERCESPSQKEVHLQARAQDGENASSLRQFLHILDSGIFLKVHDPCNILSMETFWEDEVCLDRDTPNLSPHELPPRLKTASNDCPISDMSLNILFANHQQNHAEKRIEKRTLNPKISSHLPLMKIKHY